MSPLMWDIGRAFLRPIFQFGFRLTRAGAENIPQTGPVLIVCNHLSTLDPPFVGSCTRPRRTYFMSKAELFRFAPVGWVLRKVGAFPVARGGADRDAIRTAREILARGDALVMFPEGTRSLSGNLRPFFPGAGLMALEPGVRIVPAALWGSQHRFGPVKVVFGEQVTLDDLPAGARSERARLATDRIVAAIAELVPRAGGPPQTMPQGEPSLERY
jgi:1-acyl-sn-glycerol-3-phosphate acyltransferase